VKIWIEASLNGPWGRNRQPNIPVRVEEIVAEGVAVAKAGCAIVHVHAYDEQTGRQRDDWETYARIIEGIRAQADVIVYPTIPLAGSSYAGDRTRRRFAHIEELARRGLLEWTVLDPGSVDFARFESIRDADAGFVYENSLSDIHDGMRVAQEHQLHAGFAIYEPGFSRLGAALAAAYGVPSPIYRFMFSEEFAWGFPPKPEYLDAHRALLNEVAPGAPWMIAGLGVDIRPLISHAVARGGHIRVGLEDARWGDQHTNAQLVEDAVARIRAAGGEPATSADVRATLDALAPAQRR
jgi:3-keto-5-aminohexanoate cleavage enzyme